MASERKNSRQPTRASQVSAVLTDRQQLAASLVLLLCGVTLAISWAIRSWRGHVFLDIDKPFKPHTVQLRVDLNRATWPELTLLPEISETMARRIVEDRDANGRFQTPEDLTRVRGIGPRTFRGVQPFLQAIQQVDHVAGD